MHRIEKLIDKVLNDEPVEPFDYEPKDISLIEPDDYTQALPDQGDQSP